MSSASAVVACQPVKCWGMLTRWQALHAMLTTVLYMNFGASQSYQTIPERVLAQKLEAGHSNARTGCAAF